MAFIPRIQADLRNAAVRREDEVEESGESGRSGEAVDSESEDEETYDGYIYAYPERMFSNICDRHRRKRFDVNGAQKLPETMLSTIRLLELVQKATLSAGRKNDREVIYRLKEFTFGNHPEYTALSYVWGPENAATDKAIIIDGRKQMIRDNLAQALTCITQEFLDKNSDENDTGYIWADSICINQSDSDEKSRVVPHMGQIYEHASKVYAWLGPFSQAPGYSNNVIQDGNIDKETCALILSSLEILGKLFWQHSGAEVQCLSHELLDLNRILEKCLPLLLATFANSFPVNEYTAFSNLPYWSRIWVLQEVYRARDLRYFCGLGHIFPSKEITGGVLLVEAFRNHVVENESLFKSSPVLRRFALGNLFSPELHQLLLYTSIYNPDTMSLRIALTNFCLKELPYGRKASDPRDMVFGLLGFATREERGYMKADYSLCVRDTYIKATYGLLLNGFTDVLAWAQPDKKIIEGLPTWVPDYTSTIHDSLCSHAQAKPWLPRFNAGGKAKYCYEVKTNTLFLSTANIDTIAAVGNLWTQTGADGATQTKSTSPLALLTFLQDVCDLCKRAKARPFPDKSELPKPPAVRDSAWRVPCADQIFVHGRHIRGDQRARSMHKKLFDVLPSMIHDSSHPFPAECRPYIETLLRFTGKRPFVTKKGYIGLGPADAQARDRVVVFSGFTAAYVVRHKTKIVFRYPHDYQEMLSLVGEAYVDGIMDNEAAGVDRVVVGLV